MNTNDTIYLNTDQDYHDICAFLDALSTRDPFMLWESGRMNFWRYNVHAQKDPHDPFFRDNVHIWRANTKEVVGLCISEYGENDMFIEVMPEYHAIYPDVFRWIDDHWARTRTAVEIDVFSDDTDKIHRLEAEGYAFKCHFETKRTYDLDRIDLDYVLEDGFAIQMFSESLDYASRVALVQSAFDNPTYSVDNLKGLMASPDYIDAYHLSVISPGAQHVAYCLGWHNRAKEHAGYIEPVGTHAAYRRRGFAKAIIKACFSRMKANGIETVDIASRAEPDISNFLYDALAPHTRRKVCKYGKKVQ